MTITKEELSKKYMEVQKYRGLVVGKAIDIEGYINAILNIYFAKESRQNEFMHKALDDEYFSFGLKIRILKKIKLNIEKELLEKVGRINNIRNEFAHKVPGIIPKEGPLLVSFEIDKDNPRQIEDLFNEFTDLVIKVQPELEKIFNTLIEENKDE